MRPLPELLVGYLSAFLQAGVLGLELALLLIVRTSLRQTRWDPWTWGLLSYAAGIAALVLGTVIGAVTGEASVPSLPVYMTLELIGIAAIVAGTRELVGRPGWTRALAILTGAFILFALVSEAIALPFNLRYAGHTFGMALLFACAAYEGWRGRTAIYGTGMRIFTATGAILAVDYGQYVVSMLAGRPHTDRYIALDSYVTILLDIVLGAGMLVCATDLAQRRLSEFADTDILSELRNRNAFVEALRTTVADGAVAMIDLDRLKYINDHYGHRSGDRAIATVGEMLAHIGPGSTAYRIGGDEFAIIAPGMPVEQLESELDRTRRLLAFFEDPERGQTDPLALTWGVAAFGPETPIDKALAGADEILYARKPNRVAS